jgi:hypothetical protein
MTQDERNESGLPLRFSASAVITEAAFTPKTMAANGKLAIPTPIFWGTNALAVLLLISSIMGLSFGADGFYAANPTTLPQILGQDLIALILGVPLLLGCVRLTQKGSLRGALLWTGILFYFAYSYYFYVVGVRFNALFWVYIAIVALSLYSLFGLLIHLQEIAIQDCLSRKTPTKPIAAFLLAMAGMFTALWAGLSLSKLFTESSLSPVERHVIGLDGMVLLPLMFIGGWLLWQKRSWGYLLAGILLTKLALLGFTLLVNTGLLLIWRQPVDAVQTVLFAVIMVGALMGLIAFLDGIAPPAGGMLMENGSTPSSPAEPENEWP